MKLGVVYVCPVVNWPQYEGLTRRFVSSYTMFPAEFPHKLHVVFNGGNPNVDILALFSDKNPVYLAHDNIGWDIGAFQKAASSVDCNPILFLGANTHFRRAGWLRRLMAAYEKFGPGLYGPSASFDITPHIRTTAFMCDPKLVRSWAGKISAPKDRHYFEVGPASLTSLAKRQGLPCVLVTWDGFYLRDEWRKAPNIFRRGDQSNCLMFDRHHEIYEASTPQQKIRLGRIADGNKLEYYRCAIQSRINRWFKSRG
jgi:hypothetical protein